MKNFDMYDLAKVLIVVSIIMFVGGIVYLLFM
ncbi:hypothetical protein ABAL111652_00545 [Abyssicoccus albus]|uniref:Uncharacterized protein n=1 Tax=Abyssicoccus albus TaxID=1817405 RepID=A0A3N5CCK6_9BACL|nr:hypothetical protein EDD62_0385 [Abyssicoccus albus]